jgi:DNA-binding response OmpR family regulator
MNLRERTPAEDATRLEGHCDTVVLCADEEDRDAIACWIASLLARALVADDGYHANRLLQDNGYRLLITDRLLPPWPGLDIFRALRERNPRLRIAFVESGSLDDHILAGITGVTDYLPRPLKRSALVQLLARAGSLA